MSETTTFVRRPPWRLWCELVAREVRGEASVEEALAVREEGSLIAWMRALNQIKSDVEAHDGDARLRLRSHAPLPDEPPSDYYLEQKKIFEGRHAGRVKFMRGVNARIEECRHLLHVAGLNWKLTVGDLLGSFIRVEELLLRDDIDGALGIVRAHLNRAQDAGVIE